jgi:hypothetical protein
MLSNPTTIQLIAAILLAIAILHTFSSKFFERLALKKPAHAGILHLLGEIEVVFGFWALVLVIIMFTLEGSTTTTQYIDSRNFTEPMFVFAIMVIAATRPILQIVIYTLNLLARAIPLASSISFYIITLILIPLLGSIITEPAAMTLAALILSEHFFSKNISSRLKYATLGVLFVNISIGGTLTSFAAPPVLMVAQKWGWDMAFMTSTFGWKAALAVTLNTLGLVLLFRKELIKLPNIVIKMTTRIPAALIITHFIFLIGVIVFAHHPGIFMGLFLFFLGITHAYQHYQDRLVLREGLLVAFFLAGLVVLGGQQGWWLQPLLMEMSSDTVFFGAIVLTAFTDNAALTYLGSLVEGLSDSFKYALVAGAVTGGGLTIIANAPNPAGIAILRKYFDDGAVQPLGLFLAALPPTVVAALAFKYL